MDKLKNEIPANFRQCWKAWHILPSVITPCFERESNARSRHPSSGILGSLLWSRDPHIKQYFFSQTFESLLSLCRVTIEHG